MATKDDNVQRIAERIKSGDYVVDAKAVASAILERIIAESPPR